MWITLKQQHVTSFSDLRKSFVVLTPPCYRVLLMKKHNGFQSNKSSTIRLTTNKLVVQPICRTAWQTKNGRPLRK